MSLIGLSSGEWQDTRADSFVVQACRGVIRYTASSTNQLESTFPADL